MRFRRETWGLALLAAGMPLAAQDSQQQARPELDLYIQRGERVRFQLRQELRVGGGDLQGTSQFAFDLALRPVFRRQLRNRDDVFRERFVTFRAGYQHRADFHSGQTLENRAIAELTARYPLPKAFVLEDRNRGDFRFQQGKPYSSRYRNRIWLERDLGPHGVVLTPYGFYEIGYDTSFGAWTLHRLAFGLQVPVGPHFVPELYVERQINTRSTPRRTGILGLKLNFFL